MSVLYLPFLSSAFTNYICWIYFYKMELLCLIQADANTVESNRYTPVHGYFSVLLYVYRPVETNVARLQKEGRKT